MPQVEVTFDIDANGIVHVHAKDLGTGREQSIKITASSGLSKEEIDKMVKEAEAHADEDHKRRETVDAKNQLDSLVYQTEKSLKDFKGDLDEASKSAIESALERGKQAVEKGELDEIRAATESLTQASHKLAELIYKRTVNQGQQGAAGGDGAAAGGDAGGGEGASEGPKKGGDDVVDADFEEVK